MFQRKPSNILFCGIFAWFGDSTKKFNWDKFNLLGIYNDDRGGDSCGRVVGDVIEYGLHNKKKYADFLGDHDNVPVKEPVVIGHDRKASAGHAVNETNAQPITIEENGEIVFVLAHNGTIYNTEELCNKYPTDVGKWDSDSTILAHIIYHYGFDVLADYRGSAALVMYDRREFLETGDHTVYLFKGESKYTEYSVATSVERPLHIMDKGRNSLYISSEYVPLFVIGGDSDSIFEIESNQVIVVRNGMRVPSEFVKIDRSEVGQYKVEAKTKVKYSSGVYGDDEYNIHGDTYPYNNSLVNPIDLTQEDVYDYRKRSGKIHFTRGCFYAGSTPANGTYYLKLDGEFFFNKGDDRVEVNFIDGVLMESKTSYNIAKKAYGKLSNAQRHGNVGYDILIRYSRYPVYVKIGNSAGDFKKYDQVTNSSGFYSGTLKLPYAGDYYAVTLGCVKHKYAMSYLEKPILKEFAAQIKQSDLVEPSVKQLLSNYKGGSEETYDGSFDESIEIPVNTDLIMIRQEITHELVTLLDHINTARNNIMALGDDVLEVSNTLENLNTLGDLITSDDGKFFTQTLSTKEIWENQEES